jgi:uncharacterized membrane protein HdeD (DUF308 family)
MHKKPINDVARQWWGMGLRALLALGAGIAILVTPYPHAEDLLRVFGGYLLTDGMVMLILAAVAASRHKRWGKLALSGLLGVGFGLTNLIGIGSVTMRADFVAIRTLITGLSGILVARQLIVAPSEKLLVWLLVLAGLGSIIYSFVISVGPLLAEHLLDQLAWYFALYLFTLGFLLLACSVWLFILNRKASPVGAAADAPSLL